MDGEDLFQWLGDYGQNGFSDADGDGDSDGTDFLVWQRNVGSTTPPAGCFTNRAGTDRVAVVGDGCSDRLAHGKCPGKLYTQTPVF